MRVSIVIPNWNGIDLLKKHLGKVIAVSSGAEIIVADDNSSDGSVEYVKKHFPQVIVVARKTRNGFASNVNDGVARASGDIVVLINTDVEPEKGFLAPLLAPFEDPKVFAVGCLEKSPEKDGVVLRGRGLARWEKGYYVHTRGEINNTSTAWVSGGSGAFRKSMWDTLGGMDAIFNPFYWEDIDLCYRARKADWKTLFEPKSGVWHFHEEGKIKREFTPTHVKRISYRNQFLFIWKNATDVSILLAHAVWTPVRLVQALIRGDILMIQGYVLALCRFPMVIVKRLKQAKLNKLTDTALDMN